MKQNVKNLLLVVSLLFSSAILAAPQCSAEALIQAKKLLSFHSDGDERAEILSDEKVKQLPSIRNPSNKKQKFQVLALNGYVYKGEYRMRFIYYHLGSTCVLMGQEILEIAKL